MPKQALQGGLFRTVLPVFDQAAEAVKAALRRDARFEGEFSLENGVSEHKKR